MAAQEEISRLKLERKIGKTLEVLVDESHGSHAIARSSADAPEIDGIVRVQGNGLRVGEFARVLVTGSDAHDLHARVATEQASQQNLACAF